MFAVLCAGAQCTRQNVNPSLYTRHYGMHIPSHHFAWTNVDGVVCEPAPALLCVRSRLPGSNAHAVTTAACSVPK